MRIAAPGPSAGLFRTDDRGLHTFVDKHWCEIAGLTPRQAHGQGWVQAVRADDRDRVLEAWRESVEAKSSFQCEYRINRDGAWVLSHAAPTLSASRSRST